MGLQIFKVNELECTDVRGFEHDRSRHTGFERFFPTLDTDAPAVAGPQTGETPFGMWRDEVVTTADAECEKLCRHLCANEMQAEVISAGVTTAIAVKPRQWPLRAGL